MILPANLSYRHILVNAMLQLFSVTDFHWMPKSEFEELCLGSSTFFEPSIVCPMYHAMTNGWEDLVSFLLKWGGTVQGRPSHLRSQPRGFKQRPEHVNSVIQAIMLSSSEPHSCLTKLISLASEVNPENVISLQDMQTILLHPRQITSSRTRSSTPLYYTLSIRWTIEDDRCKLTWDKSQSLRAAEADLWSTINYAAKTQDLLPPLGSRRSHLFTFAVMQQNLTAVQTLLGTGLLPVLHRSWNPYLLSVAKSFVEWTAIVPDSDCTASGIELKEHHKLISQLLSEHAHADFGDLWSAITLRHAEYWNAKLAGIVEMLVVLSTALLALLGAVIICAVAIALAALIIVPAVLVAMAVIRDNEAKIIAYPLAAFMFLLIVAFGSMVFFGGTEACSVSTRPSIGGGKKDQRSYMTQGIAGFIANVGYAGSIAALVASRNGYLDSLSFLYFSRVQKGWASIDQTRKVDEVLLRGDRDAGLTGLMLDRWVDVTRNIDKLVSLEKKLRAKGTSEKTPTVWWLYTRLNAALDGVRDYLSGSGDHRYHEHHAPVPITDHPEQQNDDNTAVIRTPHDSSSSIEAENRIVGGLQIEDGNTNTTQSEELTKKSNRNNSATTAVIQKSGQMAWSIVKDRMVPAGLWLLSLPIKAADVVNAHERRRLARLRTEGGLEEGVPLL